MSADKIYTLLRPFGLTSDEARVYVYLLGSDKQAALQVSRALGIVRTKVYSILGRLIALNLVSLAETGPWKKFQANSYEQLGILINKKKGEINALEASLPTIYEQLAGVEMVKATGSKIVNYKGFEGLKRVVWNSTGAEGTLRVFELAHDISAFLDFDFSEKVRKEWVRKGLKTSRQLTNFKKISSWTNISGFIDIWECRYIAPKVFKMEMEIAVYNNVVAMYQFQENELFCVEIYNNGLAEMQKNLFDYMWERAQRMRPLDKRGAVELVE